MIDVHIVGGGPCGAVAAIEAVRLGKNVLVSEEHKAAGGKPCSCLLSLSGLKTLENRIPWKESVENKLYGADIYLGNEMVTVERKTPVAVVCDRNEFDRLCMEAAENNGAMVEYGRRIAGGGYRSRRIIGADGALSQTAAVFGFPSIKKFVCTMQGEAKAGWDEKKVKVFLSEDYPGFLGWAIPKGGKKVEIGCGVKLPGNSLHAFEKLEKRLGIKAKNRKASIMPLRARASTAKNFGRYDIRLVGDAAGQIKATTGGGIIFGSWCASMAAGAATPLDYEIGWRIKYGKELFLHQTIRRFLDSMGNKKLESLAKKIKEKKVERLLEKDCDMEHASKVFAIVFKKPGILAGLL